MSDKMGVSNNSVQELIDWKMAEPRRGCHIYLASYGDKNTTLSLHDLANQIFITAMIRDDVAENASREDSNHTSIMLSFMPTTPLVEVVRFMLNKWQKALDKKKDSLPVTE